MDRPDSSKNRAKNFLYRIFRIKSHRDSNTEDIPNDGRQHQEENLTPNNNCEASDCSSRTRSSFRRSIKKMQTTVRGCMFRQKNERSPVHSASLQQSSVEEEAEYQSVEDVMRQQPVYSSTSLAAAPSVPQRLAEAQQHHRIPTDEILNLSSYYWYWGPMTTAEAEDKLKFKPDGTFLVRDSSSTSYLFSISFRSVGKTMHARIDYSRGMYSLYGYEGFPTIVELIEDAICKSENSVYCFSSRGELECDFPVRLIKPISRYTQVRSLKYLCRFVIRQRTNINDIPNLPLPTVLYSYLLEGPYF